MNEHSVDRVTGGPIQTRKAAATEAGKVLGKTHARARVADPLPSATLASRIIGISDRFRDMQACQADLAIGQLRDKQAMPIVFLYLDTSSIRVRAARAADSMNLLYRRLPT